MAEGLASLPQLGGDQAGVEVSVLGGEGLQLGRQGGHLRHLRPQLRGGVLLELPDVRALLRPQLLDEGRARLGLLG